MQAAFSKCVLKNSAARAIQGTLESLSFDLTSINVLEELASDLDQSKAKYGQKVSTENGLPLHTHPNYQLKSEGSKIETKYKRLRQYTTRTIWIFGHKMSVWKAKDRLPIPK